MNKKLFIKNILVLLISISGLFWFGGTLFRGVVSFRLFEPLSLIVRSELTAEAIEQTLLIIGLINLYVLPAYIIFIILYLIFLIYSDIKLKENGWFFISTLIIFLFLPMEIYLGTLDVKFTILVYTQDFSLNQGLSLLIQRISALSGLPAIALFSYFSIIYLIIFRPLKTK